MKGRIMRQAIRAIQWVMYVRFWHLKYGVFRGSTNDTYNGHGEVTKLFPQILNSVKADKRGDKHSHPLDTTHTADRPSRKDKPDPPVIAKWGVSLIAELDKAKGGRKGEKQKHGVEENESGNTKPSNVWRSLSAWSV